ILLRDEARPRADDLSATRHRAGLEVLRHEHHREIALQIRLLVDGEQDVTVADPGEDLGRQIECCYGDGSELSALPQRGECRCGSGWTECENTIHRSVASERSANPLRCVFGV